MGRRVRYALDLHALDATVLCGLASLYILSLTGTHAKGQMTTTADVEAFNRQINRAFPLRNEPLPWPETGEDGYDCKGFVALKIRALHAVGVPYSRMKVLVVSNGTANTSHMVLQLDDWILDNLSPWLWRKSDYEVLRVEDPSAVEHLFLAIH